MIENEAVVLRRQQRGADATDSTPSTGLRALLACPLRDVPVARLVPRRSSSCRGVCEFPEGLRGVWHSTSYGDVTVNTTSMGPITVEARTLKYECFSVNNDKVVLRSEPYTYVGIEFIYFTCLSFEKLSDNKYVVYNLTAANTEEGFEHVIAEKKSNNATVTVCNVSQRPAEFSLFLRNGTAVNDSVQCPNTLLGKMTVSFKDSSDRYRCPQGGLLDVCTDNRIMAFNYSLCNLGALNYSCVYTTKRGNDDVVILHNDDRPHNIFNPLSCLMATGNDTVVYATHTMGDCVPSQTALTPSTGNVVLDLRPTNTCHVAPKDVPVTQQPTTTTPANEGYRVLQDHAMVWVIASLLLLSFVLGLSG